MSTSEATERSTQLKAEGNTFFGQKDYTQAKLKFTQAIEADSGNAILFANRSACNFHLKEYLAAIDDAKQAIKIDPKYAKAHARLAHARDALGEPWHSVSNWADALEALPKSNLSPAEANQKTSYQAGLKNAKAALRRLETGEQSPLITISAGQSNSLPWLIANEMVPKLRRDQHLNSSAFVILEAYHEFMRGMSIMRSTRVTGTGRAKVMAGMNGCLEALSNAILLDQRCFVIQDQNFAKMYNNQVMMEISNAGVSSWVEKGVGSLTKDIPAFLEKNGWDRLRPALSVLVRGWILRGFMETKLRNNHSSGVHFLKEAIDLIRWGNQEWGNVPLETRGAIFAPTFLRGIRILRTECMLGIPQPDLEELLKEGTELTEDVGELSDDMISPNDPGFSLGFNHYIKGMAYTMIAWQLKARAQRAVGDQRIQHYGEAGQNYFYAAHCFPEDDEQRAWFLSCAVSCFWDAGPSPIGMYLDIIDEVKRVKPKMAKLWAISSLQQGGRDEMLKQVLATEQDLLGAIASGMTRESCVEIKPHK